MAQGTAALYDVTFTDEFTGDAEFSSGGYDIRYTPWFPPYFIDYYRESLFIGCLASRSCNETIYGGGGYLKLILSPKSNGFTVYAENRMHNYLECTGVMVFALCGASYDDASFAVNADTLGTYSVVATPMSVPEPATWMVMLLGFGAAGISLRRSRMRIYAETA